VAVDDLSLEVDEGEVCVLVGPSGCGKTTTLKMVNRLIEPTSGAIHIGGDDVLELDPVELRRRIGYVIQHVGLFPHHTVGDNIATVPKLLRWSRTRIRERIDELLDLVGLDPAEYRDRYPSELSAGSSNESAWPAHWPPTRPCCSWTSRSAPSTRHPRPAPAGVPAPAGRGAQDRRGGHARHRRGGAAGRPHRAAAPGRRARAVRATRRAAGPPGQQLRRRLRRQRPGPCRARAPPGARRCRRAGGGSRPRPPTRAARRGPTRSACGRSRCPLPSAGR
jgi:hypothetical protein